MRIGIPPAHTPPPPPLKNECSLTPLRLDFSNDDDDGEEEDDADDDDVDDYYYDYYDQEVSAFIMAIHFNIILFQR